MVPFNIKEEFCKELQGLSLKNVELKIQDETGKQYYSEMGEMLFTHFGISGPLVLSASGHISDKLKEHQFIAKIDLKPALSNEALDKRISVSYTHLVKIMYADEIESGDATEVIAEKTAEYQNLQGSVMSAAARGYVDSIVEPVDTRKYIIGAFEMLYTKFEDRPGKKHGTV